MGHRKARITKTLIRGMKLGDVVMDTEQPGFGVRRQRGEPFFFVKKFSRGQHHYESIGQVGTNGLTVEKARNRAAEIVADIRAGKTPAERRAADRSMPTVATLKERWFEVHVRAKLKPRTNEEYESLFKVHILPRIGKVRVDHLDGTHITNLQHALRKQPYRANRALAVVSKLMNFAEQQGYRQQNSNPTRHIERYREKQRKRYLSDIEIEAVGMALNSDEARSKHAPQCLQAIEFLLLTGMRLREALRLKWSEVDIDSGVIEFEDSKTGEKTTEIGEDAVALLRRIEPHNKSNYVFWSPVSPSKPMYDVKKAWFTVRKIAGIEDVRVHDLRHSFASVAVSDGGTLPMIGRLLGHANSRTTERYAHIQRNPAKRLADQTSARIAHQMGLITLTRDGDA